MIAPVGLLIPVCAPAFIPMCAPAFVFGAVIVRTPEICPKLGGAGGVAAEAAVSHRCAGGGTDLIASARSSSRHLRQTQWYCRDADRNQSKFNRCDLSHIIFPPSHVVLGLSDVSFFHWNLLLEQTPALLRTRRIFQCYGRGDWCSLVRDRMERTPVGALRTAVWPLS